MSRLGAFLELARPRQWTKNGFVLTGLLFAHVWDDTTMAEYNRDPKGKVPGTKMLFNGVKNAGQLADLVAYLKEATK